MRFIYHILIILGLAFLIFLARDDAMPLYNRATIFLNKGIEKARDQIKNINLSDKTDSAIKTILTPGPLKVSTGLTSFSKVNLSVKDVIKETNKNRGLNGNLQALTENRKLDASAKIKLDDMFKKQYFEHISPTGVGVKNLVDDQSYEYILIGENLAYGNFVDAKALLDAWMASPGHRANILNKHFTEIGVAVGKGEFNGESEWIAVQHFGAPRSLCTSINVVLYAEVKLADQKIASMKADLNQRKQRIDSGAVYGGKTTNEQIAEYNDLVQVYNKLISDTEKKNNLYNSQVQEFNNCREVIIGSTD